MTVGGGLGVDVEKKERKEKQAGRQTPPHFMHELQQLCGLTIQSAT